MRALILGLVVAILAAGTILPAAGDRITGFRNPVIPGFHPDPSVVRVGEDYYLVTSSFEFFPGVPIFHSRDLVHWRQIGHVLTRPSQVPLEGARASGGIFAPTLRYHAGTFYMITTNVTGGGNFYVTAKDPAGPWSEPVWLEGQGGIDPSLLFDDDGTVYFASNGGAPGASEGRGIYLSTLDVNTGAITSRPRLVWGGTGKRYPEGPHLYHVNGYYYLLIGEGGTEYGHMVSIGRSRSPWGPYEACPRGPILTHRDTEADQPIQGTGHADLVQDQEGRWWTVFLAFRPQADYAHHLGRETFLAPVTWDADGWPAVNEGKLISFDMKVDGLPASPVAASPVRDDFDRALGPAWNYLRNPEMASYSLSERQGWLVLHGRAATLGAVASPAFVARRQEHFDARAATRVDVTPKRKGDEAGLSVYMNPTHRYELGVRLGATGREVFLRQTVGPYLSADTATAAMPGMNPLVLEVKATPIEYVFFAGPGPSALREIGRASTRYLSSEVAGGFTGVYFGLYATGNGRRAEMPAAFDWFDYDSAAAQ
jgi:alpha-N-arabinofuranosidase